MRKLILLFIFQVILMPVFSQQTVKGKISDENSLPLPGVSVQVKNTIRGAFSDANGDYIIVAGTGTLTLVHAATNSLMGTWTFT